MNVYVTYEELKEFLMSNDLSGDLVKDDQRIKTFCMDASRAFDSFAERKFYPRSETRNYNHPDDGIIEGNFPTDTLQASLDQPRISNSELYLDDDLLELTTLTTKNGNTTISSSDYLLLNGRRYSPTPYNRIVLQPNGTTTSFTYTGTHLQANAVAGIWGYHDDWSNAWEDSQDSVQDAGGINSSVTAITVSDVNGADRLGLTPRFKVQQLIKINDEYMWITGKDTNNNTLDVVRGVNGTTAASHSNGDTIEIFRPMQPIVRAMRVLALYMYRSKDSIGTAADRELASQTGLLLMPSRWPREVWDILSRYSKRKSPI